MRRSHGGWLAAVTLLVGGCGSGPAGDDAAPAADRAEVAVPTVPVVARAAASPGATGGLTVLVSGAGGVDSPALDALATVVSGSPGVTVVVVATATANDSVGETGAAVTLIDARTAGGLAAQAVNASAADAVAAGLEAHPGVDLVVVGVDDDAAVGDDVGRSPAVAAARTATARGVPAIAVTASDDAGGLDLSATLLMVQQVLDLRLDGLLDEGGAVVLSVPSCTAGTVRDLVDTEVGAGGAPVPDCTTAPVDPDDDVEAFAAGHATLTRLS